MSLWRGIDAAPARDVKENAIIASLLSTLQLQNTSVEVSLKLEN